MINSFRKLSLLDIFSKGNNDLFQYIPHQNKYFTCASGRGGLEKCIELLGLNKNDSVLMPVLTAEGAVHPFYKKGVKVKFFDLNRSLQININKIIDIINRDFSIRCLLIIHYLGYPQKNLDEIKHICETKGIYLIEDCAQALFSHSSEGIPLGSYGDISLFSLGKTIPVIDGAVIVINSSKIILKSTDFPYNLIGMLAKLSILITLVLNNYIDGMKMSNLFWKLNSFNKSIYEFHYKMLRKAQKPMKMSYLSKRITKNLNYDHIIKNIKTNSKLIYEKIDKKKHKLLFKNYDPNYILMGVPILSNNSSSVRSLLRSKGIFCTIFDKYWNFIPVGKQETYPNASNLLENILILPVSYKSTKREILQMIEVINEI